MCGIVGFSGENNAGEFLFDGMKKLEYRGYDSSGVAYINNNKICLIKKAGRTENLEKEVRFSGAEKIGIGHTRWATHGVPSDINAHPHLSFDGKIAVVHNGIIENSSELRKMLEYNGIKFVSETDTEVIPNIISYYYNGNITQTLKRILPMLQGSYAIGVICSDNPDCIFAAKKDSPLVIGYGEGENYIASDVIACLERTKKFVYLEDYDIAEIRKNSVEIFNNGQKTTRKSVIINSNAEETTKCGYESYMQKEMYEQEKAVYTTLRQFFGYDGLKIPAFDGIGKFEKIIMVSCGSAYHVALTGKYIFEKYCGIEASAETAAEFRYRDPVLSGKTLVIGISQSGETADTLAALKLAKSKGVETLAIVNVSGSSIAREADRVIYTLAGPEIAVATTKAYSAQLAIIYALALKIMSAQNKDIKDYLSYLRKLPESVGIVCKKSEEMSMVANKIPEVKNAYFIGRGLGYPAAKEGSLKLKEISYVFSEAYAAGELKHGTISLIDNDSVVVAVISDESICEKMISNIREVKSRGAFVVTIAPKSLKKEDLFSDEVFYFPELCDMFNPSLAVIPMQYFAYAVAKSLGRDIDKPRNLAKSVTVE